MKNIDIKSLIIGALLTSTIFLGVAAVSSGTGKTIPATSTSIAGMARLSAEWDDKQKWKLRRAPLLEVMGVTAREPIGYQPFAATDRFIYFRKRIE